MPQAHHTGGTYKHVANLIIFYHFSHQLPNKSASRRPIEHKDMHASPSPHQRISLLNNSVCTTPLITRHIIKASQRA